MNISEDTARAMTVSRKTAVREVEDHQLNPADFFADVGDKDWYEGSEVLDWLGY